MMAEAAGVAMAAASGQTPLRVPVAAAAEEAPATTHEEEIGATATTTGPSLGSRMDLDVNLGAYAKEAYANPRPGGICLMAPPDQGQFAPQRKRQYDSDSDDHEDADKEFALLPHYSKLLKRQERHCIRHFLHTCIMCRLVTKVSMCV